MGCGLSASCGSRFLPLSNEDVQQLVNAVIYVAESKETTDLQGGAGHSVSCVWTVGRTHDTHVHTHSASVSVLSLASSSDRKRSVSLCTHQQTGPGLRGHGGGGAAAGQRSEVGGAR